MPAAQPRHDGFANHTPKLYSTVVQRQTRGPARPDILRTPRSIGPSTANGGQSDHASENLTAAAPSAQFAQAAPTRTAQARQAKFRAPSSHPIRRITPRSGRSAGTDENQKAAASNAARGSGPPGCRLQAIGHIVIRSRVEQQRDFPGVGIRTPLPEPPPCEERAAA